MMKSSHRLSMMIAVAGTITALAAAISIGRGNRAMDDQADGGRIAVVVRIKTPPGIDRSQIEQAMAKSVPTYQHIPGLIRKYFTISEDNRFGGIYLWENRKAADAWYNDAWRERVTKTYGAPDLLYFSVPIVVEGSVPPK